jgi:sugar phosphate isomerase/epimerase
MNKISISSTCLSRLESRRFYELSSIIRMMDRFLKESMADGFEFVLLPEWDSQNPPLTPTSAPPECEKHSIKEIVETLLTRNFPILSVHASRDIGNYLCSEEDEKVRKGIRLIHESLDFAQKVNSKICVFHFWDTWKETFPLHKLETLYQEFQDMYPKIEISIENIPTRYMNKTPFQIMQNFGHITLDLKWASLYNEFSLFAERIDQVDNVHIQGKYEDGQLIPTVGELDYKKAIDTVISAGYCGILTIELETMADYRDILKYVEKLKEQIR